MSVPMTAEGISANQTTSWTGKTESSGDDLRPRKLSGSGLQGAVEDVRSPSAVLDRATSSAEDVAHRRAMLGHVVTAGFTVAATVVAIRRGRRLGFKNLFNSVSAPKDFVYIGFLYGAGDVSQQLVTQARRNLREPKERREWDLSVDWPGVGSVTLVGCAIFGPFNHYWYTFLDRFIVGTSFKSVVKKVLLDQLSLPIPIAIFFIAMSIMRAKPDVFEELKAKFLSTYMYGSILWPTTQFFNFMFIPRANRVLFVGMIELLWTNCLCFMKDKEIDCDEDLSKEID